MSLLIFLIYSPKSCYNFFIIGKSKKKKKTKIPLPISGYLNTN